MSGPGDFILQLAAWWLPVAALAGLAALARQARIVPGWWLFAIGAYGVYVAVVLVFPTLPGISGLLPGAQYNWTGKLAAILTTLAMMALAVRLTAMRWTDFGMTLRQRAGWQRPALFGTGAMVAFMVLLQLLAADGAQADAETLAYQASLPGVDEELLYRGLMLGLLAAGLGADRSRSGLWACILVTVLFCLGHGMFVAGGALEVDAVILVYTAILGGLLAWLRVATGSVLVPILAHNLTNVVGKLI